MQFWKVRALTILSGAWQYRWYGLAVAWAICLIGWAAVAAMPDEYQVEAKVYIDTESLMGPLLKGLIVIPDPNQQVAVMLNTLITRPNLESVVRIVNPKADKLSPEQLQAQVDNIQSAVTIRPLATKNLFTIGFTNNNNNYAEQVTQTLLSILQDSNIGDKRRDSETAQSFLDKKIAEYEDQLRAAEKRRADFKATNVDLLTKGGASARMDAANSELQTAKNDLNSAMARRNTLRAQIAATPQSLPLGVVPAGTDAGGRGAGLHGSPAQQLTQAKQQLDQLKLKDTDDHPDVISMKKQIGQLEAQIKSDPNNADANSDASGTANPLYMQLRTKLADEEMNLAVQQTRIQAAAQQLADAKRDMENSLTVERQQTDQDRDYDVLTTNYQALLKSRESARLAQAVDDQQAPISFRVVEPPQKADAPAAPNRLLLNSGVLMAGLGGGFGLALVLSLLAGRFVVSDDLATQLGIPMIGVVTRLRQATDIKRMRTSALVLSASVALLLLCYVGVMFVLQTSIFRGIGA